MGKLESIGTEKMEYMEMWVESGKKLADIVHDKKFIDYLQKEDQLIAERNKKLREESEK